MVDIDVSNETLEKGPQKTAQFLVGLGAVPTIRTLLAQAGMTDDDIVEGRTLLLACLAAPRVTAVMDTDDAKTQRAAQAELDEWDEPNFGRYEATMRRHFRAQAEYVFGDLKASTGAAAVKGVATFLQRVDSLEKGREGVVSADLKKADKKAVELLATRGLDKKERARLAALVATALGPTEPLPEDPSTAASIEARRVSLVKLKGWHDEWSAAARAVVKKRGYLIRLGLASRKAPKKAAPAKAPAATPA